MQTRLKKQPKRVPFQPPLRRRLVIKIKAEKESSSSHLEEIPELLRRKRKKKTEKKKGQERFFPEKNSLFTLEKKLALAT